MNFYQDQGMWKIILSFRESISESLYFYLFSLCPQINTFLLVPMKDYILWIWTRYMNQVWNWWVCDYRQAQKMFNDLNYSFKYFCVIYSRSLIYLSRSNPCSRLCAMFITYTWKCTTFLFDFVLFYLTASCKEMYLGLCDKRCSHDFIRLVFFFNFSLNYLAEIECSIYIEFMNLFI